MNPTLDDQVDRFAGPHGDSRQVPIEDLPVEVMDLYFLEECATQQSEERRRARPVPSVRTLLRRARSSLGVRVVSERSYAPQR